MPVRLAPSLTLAVALAGALLSGAATVLANEPPILDPEATIERVATGNRFTEGPALGPDGTLYWSDIPNARIMQLDAEGKMSVFLEPPGATNGLLFDQQGRLLMCITEGEHKGIARREPDGTLRHLVTRYEGQPFIAPNDLAIDGRGRIFFTDPDYTRPNDPRPPLEPAVYRIDPPANDDEPWAIERVDTGKQRVNGIVVTPDDRYVYVSDRATQKLHRYRLEENGQLTHDKVLYDFSPDRGIDGMWLDVEGNIYGAAGQGPTTGLFVLSPEGKLLATRPMPEFSTNVVIGGANGRELFLTASTSVYKLPVTKPGMRIIRDADDR